MQPDSWHVIGVGSIGGLFAARMVAAGIPVTLLLRDPDAVADYERAAGIRVDFSDVRSPQQHVRPAAICSAGLASPPRLLLTTTKAQDTLDALTPLIHENGCGQLLMLLQNGMGVSERIHARWPELQLWNAVTTAGVWRTAPFHLQCVATGETHAGRWQTNNMTGSAQQAAAIAALAQHGIISLTDDIHRMQWRKLAVNAVINALTAIHRCRNGALLEIAAARNMLAPLADEVTHVAAAEGIDFDESVLSMAERVIRLTADNFSSMNRDAVAGRTTEIDFINGYVIGCARRHGIDVPLNDALLASVRALSLP